MTALYHVALIRWRPLDAEVRLGAGKVIVLPERGSCHQAAGGDPVCKSGFLPPVPPCQWIDNG
jgi:hypothetical protein